MDFILGYHGVRYEKCEKIGFFERGWSICVGKIEWFGCYFSMIFE